MVGIFTNSRERNLMSSECTLDRYSIYFFRAGPALRRPQNDHRPQLPRLVFAASICSASALLNFPYLRITTIKGGCEQLVHRLGVVPLHKIRTVAMPFIERGQFVVTGASHDRRPGDFIAVQMENRQHRSISRRIQKFDALPASF